MEWAITWILCLLPDITSAYQPSVQILEIEAWRMWDRAVANSLRPAVPHADVLVKFFPCGRSVVAAISHLRESPR